VKKPEDRPTVDVALRGNFFVVGIGEVEKRDKIIKELREDNERLKREKEGEQKGREEAVRENEMVKKDNERLKSEKEDALKAWEREKKSEEESIKDKERILKEKKNVVDEKQEEVEKLNTQLKVKISSISSSPTTGSSVTEKEEDVLHKGEGGRFKLHIIISLYFMYSITNVMQLRNHSNQIVNTIFADFFGSFTFCLFYLLEIYFRSFIAIFAIFVDLHNTSSAFPVFVDVYTYPPPIYSFSVSFDSYLYFIWLI
jgi:hypothetical protein